MNTPFLKPTHDNVARAKAFVFEKWKERAKEYHRPEPLDLSNACKFASLFAREIFGVRLRGNWHHQYLVAPNGQIVDLTDAAGVPANIDPHAHDRHFWGNPEHKDDMKSCKPRVDKWKREFMQGLSYQIRSGST
jgi:hypothetical protein